MNTFKRYFQWTFLQWAGAVLLACSSAPLLAHDFWIEPTTFLPSVGQLVTLQLRVGSEFIGDPVPRGDSASSQFTISDATGTRTVVGHEGAVPAGIVRATTPGLAVVGYASAGTAAEMTPEKFAQYIKKEGLEERVAATGFELSKFTDGNKKVRDLFARCAKSLLLTQTTSANVGAHEGDKALGFTLELVAERNPYTLNSGDQLPVRLTFANAPLRNALVVAINRDDPSQTLSARSDAGGRVAFRLPRNGVWLIKAVHLVPAGASTGADWQSYWASLTFELNRGDLARRDVEAVGFKGGSHVAATTQR